MKTLKSRLENKTKYSSILNRVGCINVTYSRGYFVRHISGYVGKCYKVLIYRVFSDIKKK